MPNLFRRNIERADDVEVVILQGSIWQKLELSLVENKKKKHRAVPFMPCKNLNKNWSLPNPWQDRNDSEVREIALQLLTNSWQNRQVSVGFQVKT